MITLYGIPNCDTVKKARTWLENNHIPFQFHDFRKDGLTISMLDNWFKSADWQVLLNKRSTTWRSVDTKIKESINPDSAKQLMIAHPTLIKRPVLALENTIIVGFKAEIYQSQFLE